MNKLKKAIPIIIISVIVLAVAIFLAVCRWHVPALKDNVEKKSYFSSKITYIVSQMPNMGNPLQTTETQVGLEEYRRVNYKYGYALEVRMQISKDGRIVVLSGDLSDTDAAELYGKNNASVSELTLAQLQNVNLMFNVKDENGEYSFRNVSDNAKQSVAVMDLYDYFKYVNELFVSQEFLILRFQDEDAVSGWTSVLDSIYKSVSEADLFHRTVLCIQNKGGIKYADEVLPKLMRAASESELKKLVSASKFDLEKKDVPYVLVYGPYSMIGNEKFIHYAKNLGLAVISEDNASSENELNEQSIKDLRAYRVNAIATHYPEKTAEYVQNAIQEEKAARANAG